MSRHLFNIDRKLTVGDLEVAYPAFVTKPCIQSVGFETGGKKIPLVDFGVR